MPYNKFKKLKKGTYKVLIDSTTKEGSLTFSDLLIKGKSDKEILLSSYTCHPSMGNNETSGISLLTYLAKYLHELNKIKKLNFSYRIVFHPENIGAIAYINKNIKKLKKNVIAGFVITCVGDNGNFLYIKSKENQSISNRATLNILKHHYKDFKIYEFIKGGSDERRYNAPGVDLPIGSLMRSKYGEYREYHTSLDDLKFISKEGFQKSFDLYSKILKLIDYNLKYRIRTLCEPQLGKRNLYPQISKWPDPEKFRKLENLLNFLSYADGKNDLISIADKLNVSALDLINVVEKLNKENLLTENYD